MDVTNSSTIGGSLQISTDVIAKIAKLATLEIEGVKEVSTGTMGVKSLFNKVNLQKPILVQLTDDVAEITVNIMVKYLREGAGKREKFCAEHDMHHRF